jgi:hypothetical protein
MTTYFKILTRTLLVVCLVFLVGHSTVCAAQKAPDAKQAPADVFGKDKATKQMGDHYLLLVNTAIAQFMSDDKFRQFDKSPYDGIAVAFLHAYDTSHPPSVAEMDKQLAAWKQVTSKDVWPWVYLNRMIGSNLAEKNHYADNPYFNAIVGADLGDSKGALSDFLKIWTNSLAAARDSKVPGIVCDLEFYNNYKEYDIGEIASKMSKTPAQVAEDLKRVGARMADIASETYPNSMIWLLFTALTHAGYKRIDGVPYYPSPAYVSIGMLDEIVRKKLPLKVLAGGEGSLGYCEDSVPGLKSAILKRQTDLAADLAKYVGVLELGGTLTLWSDRKFKTCNSSEANTVEDLGPYLELLLKTYRYNWVYANSEGNYYPFSASSAPRFDAVIRKAREAADSSTNKVQ